ncbi:hypothetical protein PSTG_16426 [Puccinia striiformis f. sp. tritici PST-78]|uniref:Retrovirus-related Pol polyprotein from transposon TNT 1-94-like beta-barrel domain-containing protein n=1 Tax=Puccinia striiformis f. sp. tritici PST-78 TaxID=1165861 RepID=A0A0L0UT75_9BASI|nr:hypothetical protein PSTG_16426 [Puccinia striiformis f. sp. tritici PST-78]
MGDDMSERPIDEERNNSGNIGITTASFLNTTENFDSQDATSEVRIKHVKYGQGIKGLTALVNDLATQAIVGSEIKTLIMHSNKSLTVQFVCNHLTQFSNKNKAEVREPLSSTQAVLVSTRNQKSNQHNDQKGGQGSLGAKRCTTEYHNPKLDVNHTADLCWHLHADKAPEWWQEAQAQWQANKNVNYYLSLVTLWTEIGVPEIKIALDSGASVHIFNDTKFFDKIELGNQDVICTGKEGATLPIRGVGRVILQWGSSTIAMNNCLYDPGIVIVSQRLSCDDRLQSSTLQSGG